MRVTEFLSYYLLLLSCGNITVPCLEGDKNTDERHFVIQQCSRILKNKKKCAITCRIDQQKIQIWCFDRLLLYAV